MASAVVSGRVDETIRQRADVVLRKAGLKPTDVIQAVWAAMAKTGEVPEFMRMSATTLAKQDAMDALNSFLGSLPPVNRELAGMSDDDILAMKVLDNE